MNMRHTGAVAGLDADVPYVTEDAAEFRVSIDAYRRADIFEREIKAIFNSNWIYLGHESELPNKGDFKATWIGRQSVIVARDTDGTINAFLNFCRHRGAGLVRQEKGNVRTFNCPYHGWSWKLNGELAGVKAQLLNPISHPNEGGKKYTPLKQVLYEHPRLVWGQV